MPTQQCPNCNKPHDVSVFVSGQKLRCLCGLHFEVRRNDVSQISPRIASGGSAVLRGEGSPAFDDAPAGGTAATQLRHSAVPILPGYELIELIGRGGMGEVWRARQLSLGRIVAVKLLPEKFSADPEFLGRFDKEASALAALSHPNITQIIDRGRVGSQCYFVMELVEGKSLRQLMAEGAVDVGWAVKLVAQVARAIAYAHEQHIIHRDLKPENILVDTRGQAKVVDFGLAGTRGPRDELNLTANQVAMGTLNYMAPEQRRDARAVDGRADIYSLGVVLYELLTGDLPVGRFRLPSGRVAGVPEQLDAVVARALENDADARFATADELARELEPLASTGNHTALPRSLQASSASPSIVSKRTTVVRQGFRFVRLGLTFFGAAVCVVLLWSFWRSGEAPKVVMPASRSSGPLGPRPFPPNTDGELFGRSRAEPSGASEQRTVAFIPLGDATEPWVEEEMNAKSGSWSFQADGSLHVLQAGNDTGGEKVVPRLYLAHRYYSADDVTIDVDLVYRNLGGRWDLGEEAQHFAEVSFRIRDLQVSVLTIPEVGTRLGWRYFLADGTEIQGNSAMDVAQMLEDEMPAPRENQTAHVRLELRRQGKGIEVQGFLNKQRFARKLLPGLEGRVAKIAVGCRNLECGFRNLVVEGKIAERPVLTRAGQP